jgi:hypothetical protein
VRWLLLALAPCLAAQSAPSQRVAAAFTYLQRMAAKIENQKIHDATVDALKPDTCIAHRAGLTADEKAQILKSLKAEGFLSDGDSMAGVFPPVRDDGSACPKLPQPFTNAPGSNFGGHHSYPGGLAIHESFNLTSSLNFGSEYRSKYGPDLTIDDDLLIAAPIWHDWAKTIVFQWKPDGTELDEIPIAGTPAHHILSLAETMKRGLPPDLILAQASAHAAPVLGNERKVVSWIRAAAIIARVDVLARGYLVRNHAGEWQIPRFRIEDSIHNLSDADFVVSIPAVTTADSVLKQLAHEFGFDPADTARYNNQFRNRVLSECTAERLLVIYTSAGLDGVRAEIKRKPVF